MDNGLSYAKRAMEPHSRGDHSKDDDLKVCLSTEGFAVDGRSTDDLWLDSFSTDSLAVGILWVVPPSIQVRSNRLNQQH